MKKVLFTAAWALSCSVVHAHGPRRNPLPSGLDVSLSQHLP